MPERSWNDFVQDLLFEAAEAVNDKTRDFHSPGVSDFVGSVAATVGNSLVEAKTQSFSTARDIATAISSQLIAVGETASYGLKAAGDGVSRGVAVLTDQAAVLRSWVIPAGTLRQSEKEALLQDALRKQNAVLRELHERNVANAERLEYLTWLVTQLGAVIQGLKADFDSSENGILTVTTAHGHRIKAENQAANIIAKRSDVAIGNAEALLTELGATRNAYRSLHGEMRSSRPKLRSWNEVLAEAQAECVGLPSFDNILSFDEQAGARRRLVALNEEFDALHQLQGYDYAVAGAAGILAALADILLVMVPKHPGFLGGAASEGGWLSNLTKEKFEYLLPQDTMRTLERTYPVPYDAATNSNLAQHVPGLSPRSHRLHSVGHDPILGWIFGVSDVLGNNFTAIGKDGSIVIQSGSASEEAGVKIISHVIEAFRKVGGHMLSDVSTPAGLPPPLFVLSQFLQAGEIHGQNVADIARAMYRSGYDFRHFLAGGLCVALIEVIVRIAWVAREMNEGRTLAEALPIANKPRLRTGLLLAHSVAAAINAGKIAVTQNPLSLNWAQWLALFRYLLPQVHWLLVEKENQREAFIQERLDISWTQFSSELSETWRMTFGKAPIVVL